MATNHLPQAVGFPGRLQVVHLLLKAVTVLSQPCLLLPVLTLVTVVPAQRPCSLPVARASTLHFCAGSLSQSHSSPIWNIWKPDTLACIVRYVLA